MSDAPRIENVKPKRRRWPRYLILTAVALPLFGILALPLVLRSESLRAAILERAGDAIEEASGVRATAEDFAVLWRSSAIELTGVELRAAGEQGAPFLTIERARGEIRLWSLLTSRWQLRRLEVVSPAFDLGAPRPTPQPAAEDAEPGREISIERLALEGGRIFAPGDAFAQDSWLESLRIESLAADGSLRPEELFLEIPRAAVTVARRGAGPVELALVGRLRGPLAGPFELEKLSLNGPGLALEASGRGGLEPEQPLEVELDLTAEPGLVVPDLAASGSLDAEGRLDWRKKTGRARIRARDLPAEIVEPWLGRQAMERMGAASTLLDATADLELEAGVITGQGSLDWRRGGDRLLAAEADLGRVLLTDGSFQELAGELRVTASDLRAELAVEPWLGWQAVDRMTVGGTRFDLDATYALEASAPGGARGRASFAWRRGGAKLLAAELRSTGGALRSDGSFDLDTLAGTLRLTGRDLPPELAEPWVGREALERFGAAGTHLALEADLELENLRAPKIAGHAETHWSDAEGTLLRAAVQSLDRRGGPRLQVEAELLPASPGVRRWSGELGAPGWSEIVRAGTVEGRLELELPEVAAARADLHRRWPQLVPETAYDRFAEGSLEAAAGFTGRLTDPEIDGSATWRRPDGAVLTLTAAGEPVARRGEARLEVEALELAGLRELVEEGPELAGRAAGTFELSGSAEAWTASLYLEGERLRWDAQLPEIDRATLEAESDGSTLRLSRLEASAGDRRLVAAGRVELERAFDPAAAWPGVRRAELRLEAERPVEGLDRALVDVRLADGVAEVDASEIDVPGGRGELRATIPLAALEDLPEIGRQLAGWTGPDGLVAGAEGPVALRFSLPDFDVAKLLTGFDIESPETFTAAARGELTIDLADTTAARGTIELPALTAAWEGHRLEAVEPLRLRLADRRLATERASLQLDGRAIEVSGGIDLAPRWNPAEPLAGLVTRVEARAEGVVEAALLNPYLGGAAASGPLHLSLELAGPPERLSGRMTATGPEARLVALDPYFTRLESPEVELEFEAGRTVLRVARARLNQGALELTGYREPGGEIELFASVAGARYRLDYGLSTVLSGDLHLALPAAGRGRLGGRLIVDRGVLRHDLNLEREILGSIMAPVEVTVPDPDDPLASIDLDLEIASADGVRIKNNLADLRTTWSPLIVRGTLAEPRVDGRLDVEPGGFIYLYGQSARVEQATVTLGGYPELPPVLDLDVTSSLEDPTVAREAAGRQPVAAPPPRDPVQVEEDRQALLAAGVASHYADQLAGRLGQSLGGTRISVAPILVFGETDPGARLTVSQDLSTQVAIAVSVDLRTEGRQTYLLDVHELKPFPRMAAQLFTNDERNQGATVQQTLDFGGGRADENRPRLREIRIEAPEGSERKRLRSATGLRKGDRLLDGADFDAEVDVAESLRQRGYPAAEVKVLAVPADGDKVDLEITVEPGPKVDFELRGDPLPRFARRTIRQLYRADFYEPAALEEMRQETVRTLHGLGYREPQAEITVVAGTGESDRTVVVDARGGERRPIEAIEFRGVPATVAGRLAASFAAQRDRVELLAGVDDAERRLLGLLRGMGYPEPRLASRQLEGDGDRLIVELEPGPRQRIAEILIDGVSDAEAGALKELLPLVEDDPARSDLIARGVVAIENDLRKRGFSDARARSLISDATPEAPDGLVLTYRVEPGAQQRVAEIRFDGAQATKSRWAERVAQLDQGSPVDPDEISEARRRLFQTGLFRSVVPGVERREDGQADVIFEVAERARYQLAYGLRWESSVGAGAVVDLLDRNAFGRGVTLGLRALWAADDQSARFYSIFPRVFGTALTLELFAEGREFEEPGDFGPLVTSRSEGTAQVSVPLGRHTTTRGYYRYRDSHVFEKEPDPFFPFPFDLRIRSPVLGWQLVRDTRDDKIDAARGLLASLDLTGAGDFIGSDFSYVRLLAKASHFRGLGRWRGDRLTWAQSWRLGLAETFSGQVLNREDRFFAGGEYSVRGYGNESLGARDFLGSTILPRGGEALLVVNQELRFPLAWGVRGLFFFDAGNVWETASDLGSDFFTAAGLGIRAPTPVGLVRLDVALPLDRREDDDDYKIYLGLGNIF